METIQEYIKPNIITLCGSTKFKQYFDKCMKELTLQGNIVLTLAFFEQSEGISLTNEEFSLLVELHYHKIDLCDEIFVINPNKYIGSSTQNEIEYAIKHGKKVTYMEI